MIALIKIYPVELCANIIKIIKNKYKNKRKNIMR